MHLQFVLYGVDQNGKIKKNSLFSGAFIDASHWFMLNAMW